MEKVKFTINFLRRIQPGIPRKIADADTPNLQVWIGKTSFAFYLVRKVGGRQHNINLGRWPDITLEEARQAALQRLGALVNYEDINAPASRRQPTIGDAIDYYVSCASPSTQQSVAAVLTRFASLRDRKITSVAHEEIVEIHRSNQATPTAANRAVKYLCSAINKLAAKLGIAIVNPATGVKLYPETPRGRYLNRLEAPRFIEAITRLQKEPMYAVQADAVKIMLLTGARKMNVCHMMLEEITEDGRWIIPEAKFKGRREFEITLGPEELEIIEKRRRGRTTGPVFEYRGHVLSECKKTVRKACAMAGIENFHTHDLRRTLGTWMLSCGAPVAVVSKKLGHRSITTTEQVYAHMLPDVAAEATAAAIAAMKGESN